MTPPKGKPGDGPSAGDTKSGESGPASEAFGVQDIPGKGRGLVAARSIALGELLLDEEPLVFGLPQSDMEIVGLIISAFAVVGYLASVAWKVHNSALTFDLPTLRGFCLVILFVFLSLRAGGIVVEGFFVFSRLQKLSSAEKLAYFNLSSGLPCYIPILSEALIFRSNAVSNDLCGCVCAVAALVNHSCVPTAILSWNTETGRHQVRALRAIQPEEEIAVSYIDLWQPAVARQHSLRRAMRFTCACITCTETVEENVRRLSDHRRSVCSQLERGIPEKMQNGQLEEALKDMQCLRDVTEQELGGVDNLISREMEEAIKEIQAQIKNSENSVASETPAEQSGSCTKRGSREEE